MKEVKVDIRLGDCLDVLRDFDDETFALIVTSPPYADSRAKTWCLIRSLEVQQRVK